MSRYFDFHLVISNKFNSQIPVGLVLKAVEKSLFTKNSLLQNNLSSYFPYNDYTLLQGALGLRL